MVKLVDNHDFGSNITVRLGDNRDLVFEVMVGLSSDVTVGLRGYREGLVMPTSRSDFLRYPLLLPMLWSDEVLIATSSLFVRSTVTSPDILLFNRFGMNLTMVALQDQDLFLVSLLFTDVTISLSSF